MQGAKGGGPPYDAATVFIVLIFAAQINAGDERMEFLIRCRPSWLRFLVFGLSDRTLGENTIRLFRERLTRSGTIERARKRDARRARSGRTPMRAGR
ncbi:transposase [Novosphingobium chloroacetimidivorans]|uniref:transposase n=1 Tax=Novosphingobium chloroacetimidivorans TaxID=1428314 RepID=UPI0035E41B4B